ncbi:MAG TPA: class I SAM-dependent methyltransferase [Chloroflexi bacterium]|nr:class I SAM-dependent methyltransferase [Chloroflexota bacterium]
MYDQFSPDYDRFVNWEGRLAAEMPFIERQLQAVDAGRILDVACGTGMHAIELARRGYEVTGSDLSAGMIERARVNAAQAGVKARFEAVSFGELAAALDGATFDALLCLGNSLPHVLTNADLAAALFDFAACLRPGGLLLIQNRNFDGVLAAQERWMEPQSCHEGEEEWLFVRFYDFELDGTLTFNLITLKRQGADHASHWTQQVASTRLRPWRSEELTRALEAAGFRDLVYRGDMQNAPFDPVHSPNWVVTAVRSP